MWNRTFFTAAAAIGLAVLSAQAPAATVIGSQFNHQLTPPEFCKQNTKDHMCTWVMQEASGPTALEQAPKAGNLVKLRLVACAPGSFVLQIVRRSGANNARAIRTGPLINYIGATRNCNVSAGFTIEEFALNPPVPVHQGDGLAVVATKVAFMNNSSSGPSQLFDPPLADGKPFRPRNSSSGFLMFQVLMDD